MSEKLERTAKAKLRCVISAAFGCESRESLYRGAEKCQTLKVSESNSVRNPFFSNIFIENLKVLESQIATSKSAGSESSESYCICESHSLENPVQEFQQ